MRTAKRSGRLWVWVVAIALGCGDSAPTEAGSQAEVEGIPKNEPLSGLIATTEVFKGDFDETRYQVSVTATRCMELLR